MNHYILLWRIFIHVLEIFKVRHPEWVYITHESLSYSPILTFENVFEALNIGFTEKVRQNIINHTTVELEGSELKHDVIQRDSCKNVNIWRDRLEENEIERVRSALENIASSYYDTDTW